MRRTPVRAKKQKSSVKKRKTKTSKKKAKTTICKDPLKEYQEVIKKGGNARVAALGNEDNPATVSHWFTTQSLELDRLLGGRGIPAGRVTEIFGPAFIGKSTVLDHILAGCQRQGGVAVLADVEIARDVNYSRSIGVDPAKLQYLDFERGKLTMENVFDKIEDTVDFWASKYPDTPVVIGYDSIGGTPTSDEVDKRLGAEGDDKKKNTKPGAAAKVLRTVHRKLLGKLGGTKIAVVFCNHEYETIQMGGRPGKKRETYGGEAIRLAASCRIELFNLGWIKKGDGVIVGRKVGARLIKWRFGTPWLDTEIAILPGVGVDNTWAVFERLRKAGIIVTKGSWSEMNLDGEILKFQGWNGLVTKMQEDETLFPRLVSVFQQLG